MNTIKSVLNGLWLLTIHHFAPQRELTFPFRLNETKMKVIGLSHLTLANMDQNEHLNIFTWYTYHIFSIVTNKYFIYTYCFGDNFQKCFPLFQPRRTCSLAPRVPKVYWGLLAARDHVRQSVLGIGKLGTL